MVSAHWPGWQNYCNISYSNYSNASLKNTFCEESIALTLKLVQIILKSSKVTCIKFKSNFGYTFCSLAWWCFNVVELCCFAVVEMIIHTLYWGTFLQQCMTFFAHYRNVYIVLDGRVLWCHEQSDTTCSLFLLPCQEHQRLYWEVSKKERGDTSTSSKTWL